MRTLLEMMGATPAQANTVLASLGQRYQNYPAATFDERFGPYNVGPMSDPAILRQFLQPRDPEMIIPGSQSWPSGFIRSEAPTPMQLDLLAANKPSPYPAPGQPWPMPRGKPGPILPPLPWQPPDWT